MITPEETRARAERAAEWIKKNTKFYAYFADYYESWDVSFENKQGDTIELFEGQKLTDAMFIAWAELQGFRDPIPTEQEAVFYLLKSKQKALCLSEEGWMECYWIDGTDPTNPVEEALKLMDKERGEG